MHSGQMVTTFKERLAELCYESAQPDSELAKGLGISKQTLSAWKCGTRSPKGPTIETIARYFGVQVDWLMGFDVPKDVSFIQTEKPTVENNDELYEYAAELLMKLSPANQKIIMKLTPRNIDRLFGYAERLLEEQSSE